MIARGLRNRSRRQPAAAIAFVVVALLVALMGPIPRAAGTTGDQLWLARFTPHTSGGQAVAASPDGSMVYVAANANSKLSGTNVVTIGYRASTGEQVWVARWDGGGGAEDTFVGIAASPDGERVFVLAQTTTPQGNPDFATLAYDATTGARVWARRTKGPAHWPSDIGASPDGSLVFVTGGSPGTGMDGDYYTIAYDAATGQGVWHDRYRGAGRHDTTCALAVSPDGSTLFVTGTRHHGLHGEIGAFVTLAYDARSGARLWVGHYRGTRSSFQMARNLAVSSDGTELFVVGEEGTTNGTYDFVTVALDASTGAVLWSTPYDGPTSGFDYGQFVAASPNGGMVFVVGRSDGDSADYATVAYDAETGARLWVSRYAGPGHYYDYPAGLGVSPDGARVYVTGDSVGDGTADDYGTVAYDAVSGEQLWAQRFNGPANWVDTAYGLALAPDGSVVFVTGYSAKDAVTIAYSAN